MASKALKNESGFSLIELLVTIVIIGIVASIALVAVFSALEKSRQKATMSDMRTISKAVETYVVDNGYLPTAADMAELITTLRPYASNVVPLDDHWGYTYQYTKDADGNYSVESLGKDGVDGADINLATRNDFTLDIVISNGSFTAAPVE